MRLRWPGTVLREHGILSMNQRNADFILPRNPRRNYPLVDDKLKTKQLAQAAGIHVPELYGVVQTEHHISQYEQFTEAHDSFVVKPAQGSGGKGILVISGRRGEAYIKSNGSAVTPGDVGHHMSNILSGMFSLGGLPDVALIEYCVQFDPIFEDVTFQGVPDIRIIVYRGIPVSAMARLPTRASDGKANLHQGAVGLGIDLVSGITMRGVWKTRPVQFHPDTGAALAGVQIPNWSTLMSLAARCFDLVGLGYLGVDIVLDRNLGPLVLELNARPGLSIQLAAGRGLLPMLRAVEKQKQVPADADQRVALSMALSASC